MENIKIVDNLFAHAEYSTDYQKSKYIKWDRISPNKDMVFYTDNSLTLVDQSVKNKIAWLLESPLVTRGSYSWIRDNYNLFDMIFTHNKDLLDISDKFHFAPTGGCWIDPEDQKIYEKNALLSIIASSKRSLPGHKLRHEIIRNLPMDVFGAGYRPIKDKLIGLKDYKFSFAIENAKIDYYFTEKLIDCFMTGTVPIYWGCPSIGKFFNEKGMILFDGIDDMREKMNIVNEQTYNEMKPYILENFERAKEFLMSEDYIWEKYFKN